MKGRRKVEEWGERKEDRGEKYGYYFWGDGVMTVVALMTVAGVKVMH